MQEAKVELTNEQAKLIGEAIGAEIGYHLCQWLREGNRTSIYGPISTPERCAILFGEAVGKELSKKKGIK